jgi:hypothetical protein
VKITRRQWIGLGLGSVPVLAVADAFLVEPGWIRQTDVVLDPGRRTCRLVHFTDLHYRGDELALLALVKRIDRLAPDLVCFTGDIAEELKYADEALKILRAMKAPLYGVPGNHEGWSGVDAGKISEAFAATGGAWLPDRWAYALSSQVRITGVDQAPGKATPEEGKLNILLMHYPAFADRLEGKKFDLILAGHSHGGQVRLPLVGAPVVPFDVGKYQRGLYSTPAGPLYVGTGIGWYGVRARFLCRPEIAVITV